MRRLPQPGGIESLIPLLLRAGWIGLWVGKFADDVAPTMTGRSRLSPAMACAKSAAAPPRSVEKRSWLPSAMILITYASVRPPLVACRGLTVGKSVALVNPVSHTLPFFSV